MLLRFIHLRLFIEAWQELGLGDDDLRELEMLIMKRPDRASVVQGTGGLRKLRFAPKKWNRGKRGGLRVGYVFLADAKIVYLITAYAKSQQDDLSPAEKKQIKALIEWHKNASLG